LSLLIAFGAEAQRRKSVVKWFSIGVKGGYGNSVLINSDISGDENVSMNYLTPSYFYGGRLTFTYGDKLGFGVELNKAGFGQKYDIKSNDITYNKYLKMSSRDILLFLRLSGESGGYFEIGPKFSTLKTLSVSNSIDDNFRPVDNLKDYYAPKYTGLMLGAGLSVVRTERVNVHFGFRGSYVFSDIVSDHSDNGFILNDFVYAPSYLPANAKTSPFSLQLVLEIEYFFAFWGDASCGRGRLMFFQ
jgi:hypothetical protein